MKLQEIQIQDGWLGSYVARLATSSLRAVVLTGLGSILMNVPIMYQYLDGNAQNASLVLLVKPPIADAKR